jgi:hypothetical protein
MRNNIISFFCFYLFAINVAGQSKNFDWGNNLTLDNEFTKLIYADSVGNAFFLTQNKEEDRFLEMQPLHADKPLFATKITSGKTEFKFLRTYNISSGIAFIGYEYDKKTGELNFRHNQIDWKGNLISSEPTGFLLINIDKKQDLGSIQVCISSDKSKIIIKYRAPGSEEITLYGFDEKFNKLFEKKTFLYKDSKHGLLAASDFLVSNSGDFIYKVEKIKIPKKNGEWESISDWIFVLSFESAMADSTLIMGGERTLNSIGYFLENREVIVFGTSSIKGKDLETYFSRYDIAKKQFVVTATNPLNAEMFITPGALEHSKGKPYLPRSSISIIRNSAGYFIVMDAGSYNYSSGGYGMSSVMINMVNCDVLSISTEGKINWIATLFRDHVGAVTSGQFGIIAGGIGVSTGVKLRQDDFSLYGMTGNIVGNELLFIMNDDVKNTPQPATYNEITSVRKTKQLSACLVHVSGDGKITKELISKNKGETTRWHPSYCYISEKYMYAFFDDNTLAGGVLIN